MSKIKQFLLQCSGVDLEILQKCPSDENKYVGIGGTIFFTGVLAFFSAAYAIYTVFDNYLMAAFFGIIWGLMIFNLDRYIVSSMKSRGKFGRDFAVAFPRLLMAVLLAMVISKPLELKIFQKEIDAELLVMEQEVYKEQEAKIKSRYEAQITDYSTQIDGLKAEIETAKKKRDDLGLMAIQEADGTGGSGQKNLGPIYKAKKADADRAQAELDSLQAINLPLIAEKQKAVTDLETQMQTDVAQLDRKDYGGMAARMEALDRLGAESKAIYWANIFIILLFIAIETAPIFVKLISQRSPYDYLLHQHEHVFEMAHLEEVSLSQNVVKNKVQFDTETGIYRTRKEVEVEKALTDTYLKKKKEALENQPLDWEAPFVKGPVF
ncbi:MAG TPA: DUF4407 domain-containing protein [Saprospiraceae bacterium]|nr:DUF4407 domain-containing protein [Saprospiraceae bacterium]HMQ85339.1 DUF4407 domain-containing protein [Saprospiraceae bacterium]